MIIDSNNIHHGSNKLYDPQQWKAITMGKESPKMQQWKVNELENEKEEEVRDRKRKRGDNFGSKGSGVRLSNNTNHMILDAYRQGDLVRIMWMRRGSIKPVTQARMDIFPHYALQNLVRGVSDHSPIILSTEIHVF